MCDKSAQGLSEVVNSAFAQQSPSLDATRLEVSLCVNFTLFIYKNKNDNNSDNNYNNIEQKQSLLKLQTLVFLAADSC